MLQERGEDGKQCELHCSVAKGCLAREHVEQRDIVPDLLEQDVRSDRTGKQRRTCDGHNRVRRRLHSELLRRKGRLWDETTGALGEIGLEIEQSKSCYTSKHKASWSHKTPAFKKEIVVLGTEATE